MIERLVLFLISASCLLASAKSVKDFGAAGDGVTDDTLAFRQAIAASSLSTCVSVPDGIYRTTAALVATHPICFTGDSWRLKYDGSASINAVFSVIGGPASVPHGAFFEGSSISGAIFD